MITHHSFIIFLDIDDTHPGAVFTTAFSSCMQQEFGTAGTISYFLAIAFAATTLIALLVALAIKTKYLVRQRSFNSYEPVA